MTADALVRLRRPEPLAARSAAAWSFATDGTLPARRRNCSYRSRPAFVPR